MDRFHGRRFACAAVAACDRLLLARPDRQPRAAAALAGAIMVEIVVIRRLYKRDHLDQVLATFALILMFSEGVRAGCSAPSRSISTCRRFFPARSCCPAAWPIRSIGWRSSRRASRGRGRAVPADRRTRLGIRIRAGEADREMIAALGVDIGFLYTVVFALGAALAGFAGALIGAIQSVQIGMGEPVLILAFVVIVIGGIGSIRGALVAALIVGVVDTLGRFLLPTLLSGIMEASAARGVGSALASMLIYLLMAVVLVFKPKGLFPANA
jgi:branched-chain amino acid transport system permease protein